MSSTNFPSRYTCDDDAVKIYSDMKPKVGGIGAGTLVKKFVRAGGRLTNSENEYEAQANFAPKDVANDAYPPPKSASELANGSFPVPYYVWADFVLGGLVNLIYGDGGSGKTLLTQHIAVAVSAGIKLFGRCTVQMPVLLVLAEDDYGATKTRLEAIARMFEVNLGDLPITIWCLPGADASIANIRDDGTWTPGPFLDPLRDQLTAIGRPALLIFDTVSDAASLDETKRLPVNTLCKKVFGGLCRELGATIIINAHPSKAAMADGSGYAGSTAWNNAVRNRLTLERSEPRNPRRILKVAKANYGSEAELELFLLATTFMQSAAAGRTEGDERSAVLTVMLELIDNGVQIVRSNGAGQGPEDIAVAVNGRFGMTLTKQHVRRHLGALERDGLLAYAASDKSKHLPAGFKRGPKCSN